MRIFLCKVSRVLLRKAIGKCYNNGHMDISVVIPAFNEADRLPGFLQSLIDFCKTSTHRYSIIVVDDGSRDHTSNIALGYKTQFGDLSVITLPKNMGKGYAVKQG